MRQSTDNARSVPSDTEQAIAPLYGAMQGHDVRRYLDEAGRTMARLMQIPRARGSMDVLLWDRPGETNEELIGQAGLPYFIRGLADEMPNEEYTAGSVQGHLMDDWYAWQEKYARAVGVLALLRARFADHAEQQTFAFEEPAEEEDNLVPLRS